MRTQIDVDDDALEAAAKALGTTSKKDTVNTALRLIAQRGPEAEQRITDLHALWGEDITNPEVMAQARR